MRTVDLQDILSELLGEIQDLRANQKVLSSALEKSGVKISHYDAGDLKGICLQEAIKETEYIRKSISRLDD
jgi:hypothetical protein